MQNYTDKFRGSPGRDGASSYKVPQENHRPAKTLPPFVDRGWRAGLPACANVDLAQRVPAIVAVGGGKGGAGKSLLSANLGAQLANAGRKVLLIDLDLGAANLHTYFGIGIPNKNLAQFLVYQNIPFRSIQLPSGIDGLQIICGGRDESWADMGEFGFGSFSLLWDALLGAECGEFDVVLLDLGAGIQKYTIDFFTSAHLGIVTVLPEATSIENSYSFLKATLIRLIENSGLRSSSCAAADEVRQQLFHSGSSLGKGGYLRKLESLRATYPELVDHLLSALKGRNLGLVVNQVRSQRDIDVGQSMVSVTRSYFGFDALYLGHLNYDDAAWKSLRNNRLLTVDFPYSLLARRIYEISRTVDTTVGLAPTNSSKVRRKVL
ncbi:MAG: AAA family ATPase [Zetaproteobacteria bacterium]|nr:AAA family ATPase [Zetaproteobacteria bacterium]